MRHIRNRHLLLLDLVLLAAVTLLAYALRFEGWSWSPEHQRAALMYAVICLPLRIAIYYASGLYARLWRFASVAEVERLFFATLTAALSSALLASVGFPLLGLTTVRVPVSVIFMTEVLATIAVALPRLLMRVTRHTGTFRMQRRRTDFKRVLVAGAGAAGHMLVKELQDNPDLQLLPIGFLDDDATKLGHHLADVPILASLSEAARVIRAHSVDELVIAMPRAEGRAVRQLVRAALDAGIRAKTVPGLYEIVSGRVEIGTIREVEIQDLLRRAPIETDIGPIRTQLSGRTVLVTGAGGSIGSELARQIAGLEPRELLLLGHGENPIFAICNELRAQFPKLRLTPIIADIRDARRIHHVMREHQPDAVFHAAAHKHVPLMEVNASEAITNNVMGTQNLVQAAVAAGVDHFVLISTDKAVRPSSVMGASKRVAEHIVRAAALEHRRNFVAVRFGNVLGSQGSVVPTFVEQIKRGGPVTVTDPEMRRFFMTIPEAVQLVLQAGALAKGGELFMLDMGEAVKIVDLAADLIRLSGLEPGVDIEIRFTGMREGEKLYEEMFLDHEKAFSTDHPKVLCVRDELKPGEKHLIDALINAAITGVDEAELRRTLRKMVPDYTGERERRRQVEVDTVHGDRHVPETIMARPSIVPRARPA